MALKVNAKRLDEKMVDRVGQEVMKVLADMCSNPSEIKNSMKIFVHEEDIVSSGDDSYEVKYQVIFESYEDSVKFAGLMNGKDGTRVPFLKGQWFADEVLDGFVAVADVALYAKGKEKQYKDYLARS